MIFGKVFADAIKLRLLERLSLIVCVGPQRHYKYPHKRKGKRGATPRGGEGDAKTEVGRE